MALGLATNRFLFSVGTERVNISLPDKKVTLFLETPQFNKDSNPFFRSVVNKRRFNKITNKSTRKMSYNSFYKFCIDFGCITKWNQPFRTSTCHVGWLYNFIGRPYTNHPFIFNIQVSTHWVLINSIWVELWIEFSKFRSIFTKFRSNFLEIKILLEGNSLFSWFWETFRDNVMNLYLLRLLRWFKIKLKQEKRTVRINKVLWSWISKMSIYFTFRKIRKKPVSKIIVGLNISLAITMIIFLTAAEKVESYYGCKIAAILIQYFLLSTLCWSTVQGFYMFHAFVKVTPNGIPCKRFIQKSCLFAYGKQFSTILEYYFKWNLNFCRERGKGKGREV